MGEVYLAEHPRLPRKEALKILPAEIFTNAKYRERFNRVRCSEGRRQSPPLVFRTSTTSGQSFLGKRLRSLTRWADTDRSQAREGSCEVARRWDLRQVRN